jgi:hypothetical protein
VRKRKGERRKERGECEEEERRKGRVECEKEERREKERKRRM